MKQSLKGALLSGLVFPGLGQVALGAKKRGWWLILTAILSFVVIVVSAVQKALAVIEKLAAEGKPLDVQSIIEVAASASTTPGSVMFNLFFLILIFCWLFSIVDAYRIGGRMDR